MSEVEDTFGLNRNPNLNPMEIWTNMMQINPAVSSLPFSIYAKSWEVFFSSNPDGVRKFVSEWEKTWKQFGLNFRNPLGESSQNQTLPNPFLSFNDYDKFLQNSMFGMGQEFFKIYFQIFQELFNQWKSFWKL